MRVNHVGLQVPQQLPHSMHCAQSQTRSLIGAGTDWDAESFHLARESSGPFQADY